MEANPRRWSVRARLLLLLAASSLTLLAVEAGVRLYYRLTGASLIDLYQANEEGWRQRWIERHRGRDVEHFEGSDEYHPRFGWKPRPNLRKARFGNVPPVSTNSRGWRNLRDFTFDKPAGAKRLVVVGDSFTFGEEEEDEHIWPAVLQECLCKWEVINLAVHGYGTDQQLLVLEDEGVRYHPDVVVVGLFVHNVHRNLLRFRDYAKPRFVVENGRLVLTNVPVPKPSEILADGDLARPPSYAWHWVSQRLRRLGAIPSAPRDSAEIVRLNKAILAEMKATCDRVSAKMLVVVIPNPPRPDPEIEQLITTWSQAIGYETLSLGAPLKAVEQKEGKPTYYLHFSRLGHVVTARAVRDRLRELGWVWSDELADPGLLEQRYRLALDARPLDPESQRVFAGFLTQQGKLDEAIAQYQSALAGGSTKTIEIHTNLGTIFRLKGQPDEAAKHYSTTIELDPDNPGGYMNLGDLLMSQGQCDQAERAYRQALERSAPPVVYAKLAAALAEQGRVDEAVQVCERALASLPESADLCAAFSGLLARHGRFAQAVEVARRGLALAGDHAGLINNLAWVLATCPDASLRNGTEAVRLMERLGPPAELDDPSAFDTLAAAYAEAGRFDRAVAAAERALNLAKESEQTALAGSIQTRLQGYRTGKPYRQPAPR